MRLALLMTNTDETAFAQRHPKDGEKWRSLIGAVRPAWQVDVFAVKDGVFPDALAGYDGVLIGGSPASVNDGSTWIDRLLLTIRETVEARVPLFGACFGHQAIALALGGQIGPNPSGYVFGSVPVTLTEAPSWTDADAGTIRLHAAHNEQVTALPPGARVLARSEGCEAAGFAIGDRVFTTQHHPEITAGFMAALLDEMDGSAPENALEAGRASMATPAEGPAFAEWVARFFEQTKD